MALPTVEEAALQVVGGIAGLFLVTLAWLFAEFVTTRDRSAGILLLSLSLAFVGVVIIILTRN